MVIGEVVHTDTYYPASDQSDPKSAVLERTKTTTVVQAPHHDGIGPVNESGVPFALRSVSCFFLCSNTHSYLVYRSVVE